MKINWQQKFTIGLRWRKIWTSVFIVVICVTIVHYWYDNVSFYMDPEGYMDDIGLGDDEYDDDEEYDEVCNVMGIDLRGYLDTYIYPESYDSDGDPVYGDTTDSESIVLGIEEAEDDTDIQAIIIQIDSYGGSPVAGEEIAIAAKNASKPVIALIRSAGASSAYMAAIGADRIFASASSDVGSIGVTMSYLENSRKNQIEGLGYVSLSSGKFKDTGDPDRPLSYEERALFMRDVNIIHQNFVEMVAQSRGLTNGEVAVLADGSTMLGQMALDAGLIDEIGGMPEVMKYIESQIGEEVEICW